MLSALQNISLKKVSDKRIFFLLIFESVTNYILSIAAIKFKIKVFAANTTAFFLTVASYFLEDGMFNKLYMEKGNFLFSPFSFLC